MTHHVWFTYHQLSRCDIPATTQLIELDVQNHRLEDLADLMDHVFNQGFVDARFRSYSVWKNHDGERIRDSLQVDELLKSGIGACAQTALQLVIEDRIPQVWFSYNRPNWTSESVSKQRIRLDVPETRFELVAQLTNYIFARGYVECNMRSKVFWQTPCGRRIGEHEHLQDLLEAGVGINDQSCLELMIDRVPVISLPRSPRTPCTPTKCLAAF